MSPDLRDRLVAALVGTAVGDALGAPFEGKVAPDPSAVQAWLDGSSPLVWTDDTHMALALAESLTALSGRVDPRRLGDTFAAAHARQPWRGYGPGPGMVFAAARRDGDYVGAARRLFGGHGSFGNGAAMRAAPAAMVAFPDLNTTMHLAREQAEVTHGHPEGADGAALLAGMVCAVAADHPAVVAADLVADRLQTPTVRDRVRQFVAASHDGDQVVEVARRAGTGVAAVESVPAAVACVLAHPDDFAAAVGTAIRMGGDTDTVAAMAGAIVGAAVGTAGIDRAWRDRLEAHDEIVTTAQALLDAASRR